jgi:hypothetical protein
MRELLIITLILGLGLIIYLPALSSSFQLDDGPSIRDNAAIRHLDLIEIWKFWPTRFFTYLSLALNFRFSGLNPLPYHLTNVVIHMVNSFVVYLLLRRLLRRGDFVPALGALLFLCHPLQTQAATYVIQRATSLAAGFYLLAALAGALDAGDDHPLLAFEPFGDDGHAFDAGAGFDSLATHDVGRIDDPDVWAGEVAEDGDLRDEFRLLDQEGQADLGEHSRADPAVRVREFGADVDGAGGRVDLVVDEVEFAGMVVDRLVGEFEAHFEVLLGLQFGFGGAGARSGVEVWLD